MFEGKPPNSGMSLPLDLANSEQGELRPVSWHDLVARLDAVRGLRAAIGAGETAGDASFDPESARHIAALENGKLDVNFDDLANGKPADGISRANNIGAPHGVPRK